MGLGLHRVVAARSGELALWQPGYWPGLRGMAENGLGSELASAFDEMFGGDQPATQAVRVKRGG